MTLSGEHKQADLGTSTDHSNAKDGMSKFNKKVPIDPLKITESLGFQTFRREGRKPWTKSEDELLKKLVLETSARHPDFPDTDATYWDEVSLKLGSELRKAKDCRKRWNSSLDPNLRRGKWTLEEDRKLLDAFKKHGASWQKVSLEIEGRTDDQCAKRYIEVLDPNTKDRLRKWDRDEDLELIRKVKRYGTKWRTIALEMKGRPSLTCRNRWRKIVTDVVRGKADLVIRKEVDLINGTGNMKLEMSPEPVKNEDQDSPAVQYTDLKTPHQNHLSNNTANKDPRNPTNYALTQNNSPNLNTRENTPLTELSHVLEKQLNDSTKDQQDVRHGAPINLNQYTSVPNRNNTASPRPVQSRTDWKYSLSTLLGEEIPNGFGQIDSQETAQRLIDLAKKYGISVTVHQHITHHYAPQQQSILEPETQLSRYQHFNYLPPLTEVPKLNSSNSSPAGSSGGSNSKESDLIKILNNDRSKNNGGGGSMSPPLSTYRDARSPKRSRLNHNYNNYRASNIHTYGTSRQQLYPTGGGASSSSSSSKNISQPKPTVGKTPLVTEGLEEELDFWETMKSFTLPSPHTQPVSQRHPLHYQQQNPTRFQMQSNYHPSHQLQSSSTTPGASGTFGAIYGYNEDEEDENGEDERIHHSGMYYNTANNNNNNYPSYHSTEYQHNAVPSDDESDSTGAGSSHDAEDFGVGSFGFLPFNPS